MAGTAGKGLELIPSCPEGHLRTARLHCSALEVAERLLPSLGRARKVTQNWGQTLLVTPTLTGQAATAPELLLLCPSVPLAPGRRHKAPGPQEFWCSTSPANIPLLPPHSCPQVSSEAVPC